MPRRQASKPVSADPVSGPPSTPANADFTASKPLLHAPFAAVEDAPWQHGGAASQQSEQQHADRDAVHSAEQQREDAAENSSHLIQMFLSNMAHLPATDAGAATASQQQQHTELDSLPPPPPPAHAEAEGEDNAQELAEALDASAKVPKPKKAKRKTKADQQQEQQQQPPAQAYQQSRLQQNNDNEVQVPPPPAPYEPPAIPEPNFALIPNAANHAATATAIAAGPHPMDVEVDIGVESHQEPVGENESVEIATDTRPGAATLGIAAEAKPSPSKKRVLRKKATMRPETGPGSSGRGTGRGLTLSGKPESMYNTGGNLGGRIKWTDEETNTLMHALLEVCNYKRMLRAEARAKEQVQTQPPKIERDMDTQGPTDGSETQTQEQDGKVSSTDADPIVDGSTYTAPAPDPPADPTSTSDAASAILSQHVPTPSTQAINSVQPYHAVLKLHGKAGVRSTILHERNNVQLKDKSRNELLKLRRAKEPIPFWKSMLHDTLWDDAEEPILPVIDPPPLSDEAKEELDRLLQPTPPAPSAPRARARAARTHGARMGKGRGRKRKAAAGPDADQAVTATMEIASENPNAMTTATAVPAPPAPYDGGPASAAVVHEPSNTSTSTDAAPILDPALVADGVEAAPYGGVQPSAAASDDGKGRGRGRGRPRGARGAARGSGRGRGGKQTAIVADTSAFADVQPSNTDSGAMPPHQTRVEVDHAAQDAMAVLPTRGRGVRGGTGRGARGGRGRGRGRGGATNAIQPSQADEEAAAKALTELDVGAQSALAGTTQPNAYSGAAQVQQGSAQQEHELSQIQQAAQAAAQSHVQEQVQSQAAVAADGSSGVSKKRTAPTEGKGDDAPPKRSRKELAAEGLIVLETQVEAEAGAAAGGHDSEDEAQETIAASL
ncbi:hypothetical protein K437DRAFT_276236 [Tilletiaria anomala UBC 951]|uniref:Uncharacterized protein n=1 Tax=Tilletiaria anomala (strain ATCC 24038 / CBS 436.72 / UBC 951) TaxID=1037660 RepID=A0A066VE33_TILAU|nr:uncharacterized protein K437DRAFT_276236 [Tilletiaria anomala UBC 951]KDN38563.1 hypothetical protein K437DRAFT_276236 [Tilletiaria anomala UBC 951]